ncbi:MAG: CCA tRNA nucleotidyltransferase [Paracoccaceae bacterium]|nr:MAG: CCA tRNA nucleotidyltransferase [Paracoccaceae bacterium]
MIVTGDWLTRAETRAVFAALAADGAQVLAVGGCVRNALLGQPVHDVDIATGARPEVVTRLAERAGLRVVPTGIDHGTVTVVSGGIAHEVTTFRRDIETDGRRAVVAFSDRIGDDAARRDFTMNALYCTAGGAVIDPLHGLQDVMAGRVRFVGDPQARIAEDYLRILRFFRFHAWYGRDGLDPDGLAACAALADGIDRLSRERLGAEMRRLLSAPDPAPAVAAMAAAGVLARVLPGADARALPVLVHLEGDATIRWLRRLAALGGEGVDTALRLSRAEAAALDALRDGAAGGQGAAVLGYRLGAGDAADALLLRAALTGMPLPPGWQPEIARGAAARFPVRAADLMPALSGPAIGDRLRLLEDRWIASDFRLTRDELLS